MRSIDHAMEEASAWADLPGVASVAPVKRDGRDVIEVRVSGPSQELARKIPASVQGYPVVILGFEPPIAAQRRTEP